jgi:phage shock protein A
MGIFRRLNTVLKSNLNALVDKAEDPEKLISQTVTDMEAETKKARRELVSTLGAAKRLVKKHQDLENEAQQWEDKAVLALREGNEDLAREALRRKAKASKQAEEAKRQANQQESAAEEMKSTLERIEAKLEDLKERKGSLASQVSRARQGSADEAGGQSRFGSSTFDDLERMGGRVDQLDAEVEAHDVLRDDKQAEVDAKFRKLERGSEQDAVEDELSSLKKKLGG